MKRNVDAISKFLEVNHSPEIKALRAPWRRMADVIIAASEQPVVEDIEVVVDEVIDEVVKVTEIEVQIPPIIEDDVIRDEDESSEKA